MADVAARYTGEGYHISHISPVNEPQYNWDSGQEGSGWTNDEVAALARELICRWMTGAFHRHSLGRIR